MPTIKLKLSVPGYQPSSKTSPLNPTIKLSPKGKEKALEPDHAAPVIKLSTPAPAALVTTSTISSKDVSKTEPALSASTSVRTVDSDAPTASLANGGQASTSNDILPQMINDTSDVVAAPSPNGDQISVPPKHPIQSTQYQVKPSQTRPSAIPPRLLPVNIASPAHSTPSPSTPAHTTPPPAPAPTPGTPTIKIEADLQTPTAGPSTPTAESPAPDTVVFISEDSKSNIEEGKRGRSTAKVAKIRRPFKELAQKWLTDIKKRDDYGLFLEPVNPDDYPGYLEAVGGEDKMMDFQTMQGRLDNREYRDFDQISADLNMVVTAAQNFNPKGSIPHSQAGKILNYGLKFIHRYRYLVSTPSPSPVRDAGSATPWRGRSRTTGRENTTLSEDGTPSAPVTAGTTLKSTKPEIPAYLQIPDQMLNFPPNSLQALAVGLNLNGGRRVHLKKYIRGREKFIGKWRDWDYDGSRDIWEMDEIDQWFEGMRMKGSTGLKNVVDYKNLKSEGRWWEWDGVGGSSGQPPLPGAQIPRPESISRRRDLGWDEWGVYPDTEAEMGVLSRNRATQAKGDNMSSGHGDVEGRLEVLADQLRHPNFRFSKMVNGAAPVLNIYDDTTAQRRCGDWLREMTTGGVGGEAYIRSVEKFVKGALDGAGRRRQTLNGGSTDRKALTVPSDDTPLHEYVYTVYQGGILQNDSVKHVRQTIDKVQTIITPKAVSHLQTDQPSSNINNLTHPQLTSLAKSAYTRQALRSLTSPYLPLDIRPLLKLSKDFMAEGVAGKQGVVLGLKYTGKEIVKLSESVSKALRDGSNSTVATTTTSTNEQTKQETKSETVKRSREDDLPRPNPNKKPKLSPGVGDNVQSNASSPLSQAPDSPPSFDTKKLDSSEEGPKDPLDALRLELVALTKFYPLTALRKMSRAEADQFLPPAVKDLMSR